MAQSIQEFVESRRTARMTHEPQVNPDEIVIRSFLGPAALAKRIETQQAMVRAQRESHENDQKVHIQEQMRIQQQLEARYRPAGATASSPGRHSQTADTTAAPTGPPSVSQQQQDLVDKYRRQMEEEQKARAVASRVGPFLRLRSNAEDDRRAALRATTAPSASVANNNNTIRSLGSTAKKSQKLDNTSRSDGGGRGRASPLSVEGTGGGQQNVGQPQPPRHNGPRYVIHTGMSVFHDDIPSKPSTANGRPHAANTTAVGGANSDSTIIASSSSGGGVEGGGTLSSTTTKPLPLTTDSLSPQISAATGMMQGATTATGHDSVDRPSTQQHHRQPPPPLFANPSSLVRDEVAHRSIHQGPVIFNYSPRQQQKQSINGGCTYYDDNAIRPQASSSPHSSPSPGSRYSTAGSPTTSRGQQLPQINNSGTSPTTSSLRHVPLELQPLVVSVGNDPKQYVTPTPVSKWYPSLQTRLAEKAALELAANPPPEPEPTIANGDTPPLGTTAPSASPPPKKKKKAPVDTSVVSAASLSPTLGAALELNIKSSLYDATLSAQAHKHRDKIWEVAMQFQQPPPPPVIKKKKASVSGPGAKRMSSVSAGNRGSTPPKKKKGVQGPPPDPTTTIHPNLRSIFSQLRSVTDDQCRISSLKFTQAMKELGVTDLTHINSIFLHMESKNTCPGYVQLGSAMAVFHQLLNGEYTRQLLADVCFDLFDLDDRGYIHKAHLDCLRYLRTGLDGGTNQQNKNNNNATSSSSNTVVSGNISEYTTTSSEVEEALRLSSRKCARHILVEEEERRNKLDVLVGKKGSLNVSNLIPNAPPPQPTNHNRYDHFELPQSSAAPQSSTIPTATNDSFHTEGNAAPSTNFLGTNANVINPDTQPSVPHALCTPHMVRVLQGLFIDVRIAEEEEYIARVIRKGKKGKASKKKLPALPATQNSYIPISNMRVAHISREAFRTHFATSPHLVEAFACRWLLLLAVGDHEQLVLDDGALTQSNVFVDEDDEDVASKPTTFRLVSMSDVALTAIDRYENPPTFPPAPTTS